MTLKIWIVQYLQITVLWSCICPLLSIRNIALYPLGVSDRKVIPDDRFTASSYYDFLYKYKPQYARLNLKNWAWMTKAPNDSSDYLQIDFGEVFVIRAVATKGLHRFRYFRAFTAWTTEYKISTSTDNVTWSLYQTGGKVKNFLGNTNSYAVKTNVLVSPIEARFIRFIPTKFYRWKALRVEVYGFKKLARETIQDIRLTGGWTPNQGYVEVNIGGKWGKIHAKHWTTRESNVACHILGMAGTASPWPPPAIREVPTIMYLESCHGNETSLADCKSASQIEQNISTFYIRGVSCGHPTVIFQGNQKAPFVTSKTSDPWIQLYLPRSVYIYAVTFNRSCQSDSQYHIQPVVSLYDTTSGNNIQCGVTMDNASEQLAKCDIDFKVNVVRIRSSDENTNLTLCSEPRLSALDNFTNIRGVLYEVWNNCNASNESSLLKSNEVFFGPPNISSVSPSFSSTAFSGISNYILREQGYVLVDTSRLYFMAASCDDECEIWLTIVAEQGLGNGFTNHSYLTIKIESPTFPNHYKLSRSQYRFRNFSKCHLYHMEVYMRQRIHNDYLTVVLKSPDEKLMPLFPSEFLYWERPGSRVLKFDITNKISREVKIGANLTVEAVYKFCCEGLVCPSCPLLIQLHAFDRVITVNKRLEMNCKEHKMRAYLFATVQPGNYSIELRYYFPDDLEDHEFLTYRQTKKRLVESIHVPDFIGLHCSFADVICPDWKVSSRDNQSCRWSLVKTEKRRGGFIALRRPGISSLQSPLTLVDYDHEHLKLCMEFSYLIPSNTTSRLEVFRNETLGEELIWVLQGNQGNSWTKARIPMKLFKGGYQISFKGYSRTNGSISVAIRDVQLNGRLCTLHPVFAEPGFQCKVTEFKCGNGQCITKRLRCNGIHGDCLDDSDEDECICRTGHFTCANRKCIHHTKLCDGKRDCPNGEDEHHCGPKCSEYQCLDGTCSHCGQQVSCEDKLHRRSCDFYSTKEMLKNKTCEMQVQREVCDFDNDLCGFQNDTTGSLFWEFFKPADYQVKKHNIPDHDHMSLTDQGNYILLKTNKSAKIGYGRLMKEWNIPVTACMQFWYFIPVASGSRLEIVVRTASTTILLWNSSTPTGDWAFGQVPLPGISTGQIIITGYVSKHPLALDDLGFVEGGCATIYYQKNLDHNRDGDWRIYPKPDGGRCFRFWFYSGNRYLGKKLSVEFQTEKSLTEEWSYRGATDGWSFAQLPIPEGQQRLQIKIRNLTNDYIFEIKRPSFSKETCHKIPEHQECFDYEILTYSDRREDVIARDKIFRGCDDHLSTTTWYRVVGSAGNQLAQLCVKGKSFCSTKYMGWVNGEHPTVEDGIVERQLCFASDDECCSMKTNVAIRKCKNYFVYKFSRKISTCPSKYCTVYKQEWRDHLIGVSNATIIPDVRFKASSSLGGAYQPSYARLNVVAALSEFYHNHYSNRYSSRYLYNHRPPYSYSYRDVSGWAPNSLDDPNDYLEIDLSSEFVIRAVATQGHPRRDYWTTEYKILTSTDDTHWTVYQSGGKVKLFLGNKGGNIVAKNTLLDTRTIGRYIRFVPTKYHKWKILRVEVYGYKKELESLEQNTRDEWEGWSNGRDGKVQWEVLGERSYEKVANSIKASSQSQVLDDDLPENHMLDVGFSPGQDNHSVGTELRETLDEMTICLWTLINSSSPITISVTYEQDKKEKYIIAFLEMDNRPRNINNKWMHICFTWMSDFGVWQTYFNGNVRHNGNGVLDRSELYRGNRISVTFDSKDQKTEVKYSRLNMWKKVQHAQYILYMSYTCGKEAGNLLEWKDYLRMLLRGSGDFRINGSTCQGKQGKVLSLTGASGTAHNLARIESPRYQRALKSPWRCLKFKYKMWGPGAKVLKIYQKYDKEYSKRPIWMVKDSDDSRWRDGQVSLTAVTTYKLAIEGEVTDTPGVMSIGALHTTEGYCDHIMPPSAREACNEILTNDSGYIVSPYYPGYYDGNANCTWTIKAKKGHVVRMEFKVFDIEFSSRCSKEFVEVYDGEETMLSSRIGRYCGTRYRQIIESLSQTVKIIFRSDKYVERSGFKAYYQLIKGADDEGCVHDCPLLCTCRRETDGGRILIISHQLESIPDRLPQNTRATLFTGSRIHQVESNVFYKRSYLSLIDLSVNRVILIDDKAFEKLPSLKTLRLNRNFIRKVSKTMFSGLEKLEAMDLGENFISDVPSDTFYGFPGLRALSLRSNQIDELHESTFQNSTNLTYIYLQDNLLKSIPAGLFRHQGSLEILFLHLNRIQRIHKSSFEGLENLRKLSLKNNSINEQSIPKDLFKNLQKLEYLSTDSFIMCCYANKSIPDLECVSPGNEFSSCDDMLKSLLVKVCIWAECFFATFGNLAVMSWWIFLSTRRRRTRRKINSVQSLLFCHLAFADLLMGIYLMLIGTYNEIWKGEYFLHDVEWRAGIKCQIAGAIAILSSEVSVMILVCITADRINTILFQFSGKRTNLKAAHVLCLFIWVTGFIMSFTPVLVPSYFDDKVSGFSFYGRSTVCLPLQLSTARPDGWEYSVALFIAFNGAAFLFILGGYVAIFIKVRESSRNVRSTSSADSAVGKRVFFVILTDFCCWMPVMVLGLLSLVHDFDEPSVYVWVAVFVLPVNSAINPVLYTFSSSQTVKRMKSIMRKSKEQSLSKNNDFLKRRNAGQSSQTENAFTNQETTENETEPNKSQEKEILMTERQLVVEADDDQGRKTVTNLVIIKKTQP